MKNELDKVIEELQALQALYSPTGDKWERCIRGAYTDAIMIVRKHKEKCSLNDNSLAIAVHALQCISDPIGKFSKDLKEGEIINQHTMQLSNDANILKAWADIALKKITHGQTDKV